MSDTSAASALLESFDNAQPVVAARLPVDLTLEGALRIQREIIGMRRARGERTMGYKIGFTNRTIWARYGVHHPIWSPIFESTVTLLDRPEARIGLTRFVEPRLEPEIIVRMAEAPRSADAAAVADAVEWVAHGFEIVQSAYPGWRFSGAQAFASQGLHGALLIGPRFAADAFGDPVRLPGRLAALRLSIHLDDGPEAVDSGVGANVLDGPLHAIAHLVAALSADGEVLQPGDIITTGTITDAQPLAAGQRWRTELTDAGPLSNMRLSIDAT